MNWKEVESLDRNNTAFLLPIGPVEQHGIHAPLGTDIFIAEHVMGKCAEYLSQNNYDVVICPAVSYINALFSLPYPGSISIRKKIVEEYLFDIMSSIAVEGFNNIILISQHLDPPWVRTAERVCTRINDEYGTRSIHGFERIVMDMVVLGKKLGSLEELDLDGDTHAGVYETAPMLYIHEDLIEQDYLTSLPTMKIPFEDMKKVNSFKDLGEGLGYTGNLSQVTKQVGKEIIDYYENTFKKVILRHMQGEDVYEVLKCSHLFN
ncbi:creatininase family protein [Bacillus sp. M6-12]|uniref:creatininase family protein n=1 Tax=Bacillus sp. M6-12 TaxID=2054166 RepID=UPI002155C801|nr:creatininase family protein [Bacillus sp. M6-12]